MTFLGSPENAQRMVAEIEAAGQEVTGPEIERRRLAWAKEDQRKEAEEHERALADIPEPPTTTFIQADDEAPPFTPDSEAEKDWLAESLRKGAYSQQLDVAEPEPAPVPEVKRGRGRPKGSKSKNPKPKAIKPRSIKTVRAFFKAQSFVPDAWAGLCCSILLYMDGKLSDDELHTDGLAACGVAEAQQG